MKFNKGDKIRCLKSVWSDMERKSKTEIGNIYTVLETGAPNKRIHEQAVALAEVKGLFWERDFELAVDNSEPVVCKKCKKGVNRVHRLVSKHQDSELYLGIELCSECFFRS